ncbi:MAG: 4Fe-4S binding protein [Syntrophales bacterium]|nr:4Fe-4S binding protein [Syntrophales bacterium]
MDKIIRKIIEINEDLCNGCGNCVTSCSEGALQIIDGKAKIISEFFCDGLGACVGECSTGALRIVERYAYPFNEEVVKKHLDQKKDATMSCDCPSAHIRSFDKSLVCKSVNGPEKFYSMLEKSALSHWPIKIKLIPASAPFLKGAHLLVLTDCTAVVHPSLHRDLIKNRVVMMGCPKFDNVMEYVQKFTDIFLTAEVKSVTVAFMEVPCCSNLLMIVKRGMKAADKKIPLEKTVLNLGK